MAEKKLGPRNLEYRCVQGSAFQTAKMGRRLAVLLAPAMAGIIKAFRMPEPQEGDNEKVAQQKEDARDAVIYQSFTQLASTLDERFDAILKELAEMVQVKWEGQWENVDVHQDEFVQDVSTLFLIAFFALEVNFKSFLSELLAKGSAARTRASQKDG